MNHISAREFLGEVIGTGILVSFGLGSVACAVATDLSLSLPVIAFIWGGALALAIQLTGPMSGAHLNPAITIAFAAWSGFPSRKVCGYIIAQFIGAILGAMIVYLSFSSAISEYEAANAVIRGEMGSEATAMIFAEYYPNPGGKPLVESLPMWQAALAEFLGTTGLALVVFGMILWTQHGLPEKLLPILIGLGLAVLIYLIAPTTQAGFNPARDLGPRLFSALAGWKTVPFTVNGSGWFWVYVMSPILGALTGGAIIRIFSSKKMKA